MKHKPKSKSIHTSKFQLWLQRQYNLQLAARDTVLTTQHTLRPYPILICLCFLEVGDCWCTATCNNTAHFSVLQQVKQLCHDIPSFSNTLNTATASRRSHNGTRGWTWLHLEMSGNLSFKDEKAAVGDTLVSSTEINEGGGFI